MVGAHHDKGNEDLPSRSPGYASHQRHKRCKQAGARGTINQSQNTTKRAPHCATLKAESWDNQRISRHCAWTRKRNARLARTLSTVSEIKATSHTTAIGSTHRSGCCIVTLAYSIVGNGSSPCNVVRDSCLQVSGGRYIPSS